MGRTRANLARGLSSRAELAQLSAQSLWMIIARIGMFVVNLLCSVVLARWWGPHGFGEYSAASAVAVMLLLFGLLGADQLFLNGSATLAQLTRRSREAALLVATAAAVCALAWPGADSSEQALVLALGVSAALQIAQQPFLLEPQRRLAIGVRAGRELGLGLFPTLSVILLVVMGGGVLMAGWVILGSTVTATLFARIRMNTCHVEAPRLRWRDGVWFALSSAMYTLYFQMDMVILALLGTVRDVAAYKVAYGLVIAGVVIPVALNNEVMRPRLYRAGVLSSEGRRVAGYFALIAMALGVACGSFLFFLGPYLIHTVYGSAYGRAGPLVEILAFAMPLHYLGSFAANVAVAANKMRHVVAVQAVLAVLNVFANCVFIPDFGARAAATITVLTEAAALAAYAPILLRIARYAREGQAISRESVLDAG